MPTILVVDDKALNRRVLTTLLGGRGHRLMEAASGREAIEKAAAEDPELIITDILMPHMDGYELVENIRALKPRRKAEIIFYSATYIEREARALALACGISHIICKPAEPEEILRTVDAALASGPHAESARDAASTNPVEAIRVLNSKLYDKVLEIEELNDRLETRVAERTEELENTARALREEMVRRKNAEEETIRKSAEQARLKADLLSHVSHELRSPLAVVHQFTTILLDGLGGPLTGTQREYLEISLRNIDQLKRMIDDLLEASRVDTSKLEVRRSTTSMNDILTLAADSHDALARAKQIAITVDCRGDLPRAYADRARILQVLTNLLDNAVKFSPAQTTITLRAEVLADDPAFLVLSVADQGKGIAPEDAERIFERLYQVDHGERASRGGLGLGLYICKELITLHGGKIWVDSELHRGSIFRFTLPIFTIKGLIAPIVMKDGELAPSLAVLSIELYTPALSQSQRERERTLRQVGQILERCMLPDLDVLLPMQSGARSDFFHVVARTDRHGSEVMASRFRSQLSQYQESRSEEFRCVVSSEIFELSDAYLNLPLDGCVARVAEDIKRRLQIQTSKGAMNGDGKENTAGGG